MIKRITGRWIVLLSFILFLFTLSINAQDNTDKEELTERQGSYLTFDLFSSLNKYSPRWRIGYIQEINQKWKAGINLGFGNRKLSYTQYVDEIFGEEYVLWEVRPELYYVIRNTQKSTFYGSIELYYIHHNDVYYNSQYTLVSGECNSYEKADYLRQKYGFNFNIGSFTDFGRRIGINYFLGLGLKIRNNSFSNVINPMPTECYWIDMYDTFEYRSQDGLEAGFNFSIGLKLYFKP